MKKILLVDDSHAITDLVTRMLISTGDYIVKAENDSRQAVRAVDAFQPDLIIMDIDMPNLDGGDISSRLERDPSTRDIPIIFLTSLCSPDEADSSRKASSSQRFLAKPVTRTTLLTEVKAVVSPPRTEPFLPVFHHLPLRCGLAG